MMTFKVFVICASLVLAKAANPDVLSKRDSSVETHHFAENTVDPYAAYYEQYAQQVAENPSALIEKQGFASSMENVFGSEASLVLGTIGAIMGTLAAVGVVLNNNNVNELSKDQDSICTTTRALGATSLATSAITGTLGNLVAAATTTSYASIVDVNARLNLIEAAINAYATPDC